MDNGVYQQEIFNFLNVRMHGAGSDMITIGRDIMHKAQCLWLLQHRQHKPIADGLKVASPAGHGFRVQSVLTLREQAGTRNIQDIASHLLIS